MSQHRRQSHWDDRYLATGGTTAPWFEAEPQLSLDLIELVGATPGDSIIHLGGGPSSLTARLEQGGYTDLTVLDVSAQALDTAKQGVERPEEVTWIRADLLAWSPARCWKVWQDRAVFHFLVDPDERRTYR